MGTTQQQTIKKLVNSLTLTTKTGTAAMDEAVRKFGYSSLSALKGAYSQHRKDYLYSNEGTQKFLEGCCNIRLNNKDTGAITGADAGGSIEKTAESVVPEATVASNLKASQYNSFTRNGLKVNVTYASSYDSRDFWDEESMQKKEKLVVKNLYNWWLGDSLKLINESLGINFTDGRASINEMDVKFVDSYYDDPVSLSATTDMGRASKLTLTINMHHYTKLSASDKNGADDEKEYAYLDRLLLDKLTEAALAANINYFYDLPEDIQKGLVSITGGWDDRSKYGIESAAGYSSYDYVLSYYPAEIGYILLRYLAKQNADKTGASSISYNLDKTASTITGPFKGTWDAAKYASTVQKIDASKDTKKSTIKGNKLANTILAGSGGSEIYGKTGDDVLYGGIGKDTFHYASGDGKDVIGNYQSGKDIIHISSGTLRGGSVVGNDVVLKVGSGTITVKNAKGKKLSISTGKSAPKVYTYGNSVKTQHAVILELVESLATTQKTGTAAMDEAVRKFGYSSLSALKGAYSQHRKDYLYSNEGTQKFLEGCCNIRLNNKDTGAITGADAGGSIEKTAESVVPEATVASNLKASQYNSFTRNGLKVNVTYASSYDSRDFWDEESMQKKEKLVVKNLYNWWLGDSLKLINESLGINFTDGRASINEMDVKFVDSYYDDPVSLSATTDMGRASKLTLTINMHHYTKLSASDKNGADDEKEYAYLDRLLLDKLTEAALAANINYFYDLPEDIQKGLVSITGGWDDRSKYGIESAAGYSSYDYVLSYYPAEKGYILLRYLAKQQSNASLPAQLVVSQDGQTITAQAGFSGSFDASEYSGLVKTIDASKAKKAVTIKGNHKANIIRASKGGGNYYGMEGNDILYGNNGKDTFWYAKGDGNDTIYNYTSGKDKIRISSGFVYSSSVKGSDVILNVGSGKITVKGAKNKKITVVDSLGTATRLYGNQTFLPKGVSYDAKKTTLTVKAPFTGTIDAADYVKTVKNINASKDTKAVVLKGTAAANTLRAGSGGSNLYGQKGNDILYGGKGTDVFWYANGDGKDTIYNYTAGKDKIRLTSGSISKATVSGKDVILEIGAGSICVKNAKGKKITVIDANGKTTSKVYGNATASSKMLASSSFALEKESMNYVSASSQMLDNVAGIPAALDSSLATVKDVSGSNRANNLSLAASTTIAPASGNSTNLNAVCYRS